MGFVKMAGVTKGIVIDTNDPAGFHRIKVRIPQLHGTMTDTPYQNAEPYMKSSIVPTKDLPWCEVSYPFGNNTPPEPNQVVLVAFIDGDSSQPVVIGWLGYEYTDQEDVYEVREVWMN